METKRMESNKPNSAETSTKTGSAKRKLLWLFIIILIVVLIPFFAIPAYLSSNSGKNMILSKINNVIDGKLNVDSLSIGWFSGVKADNLNFNDADGSTTVTAVKIAARPKYLALVGGKVEIDKAVIDKPKVEMTIGKKTTESNINNASSDDKKTNTGQSIAIPLEKINLTINDGNFKINSFSENNAPETLELKNINSKLAIRPLGSKSNFDISMTIADTNQNADISAAGDIKTTDKKWSLENATGNLELKINGLELATLAPLMEILDVNITAAGKVMANVDAKLEKGQFQNLEAVISAENLDIAGEILKGDRIQNKNLQTDIQLSTTKESIKIDTFNIQADGLTAQAKGTVPKTLRSLEDFLTADSDDTLQAQFDCDLAKTLKQIKTIANFKQDFDINYGRVSGDINTEALAGKRTINSKIKLWALEGKFPIKQIVLSKPVEVDAKIVAHEKIVTVEKLNVDSSFVKAQLGGTTDNMNYTADVDLERFKADVGQFFEIKPQLSGTARLIGKGSLIKRIFASTGNAALKNLIVTTPNGDVISEPTVNAGYDFSVDIDKQIFNLTNSSISAAAGQVNIQNLSAPFGKQTAAPMQLNADVAVELEKLMPIIRATKKVDPKANFAGIVKGDFTLTKTADIIEAKTKRIAISNLKIAYPDKKPFSQSQMTVAFAGKFDLANKLYDIQTLDIASPQIKLTGSLYDSELGANRQTKGNFKANYDLSAVTSIVSPFMPGGLSAVGKRNDSLWLSSTYPQNDPDGFKSNLNAKTTFGFDSAEYMGLLIGKSDFNVQMNNGIMMVNPFSSTVNKGVLNFAAIADINAKPAVMKLPRAMKILDKIQIDHRTTDALLLYVNPLFADAVNVDGVLSFDCEKMSIPFDKTHKNDIEITGTLAIDNMHLGSPLLNQIAQLAGLRNNPVVTVLPTRFVLANGVLSYDNMQMNIENKSVNFAGKIGLDKTMRMNVTLPWTHNGQRITLPLKGTVNKPEIDMGKLIESQVQQELENQIRKGLEKLLR